MKFIYLIVLFIFGASGPSFASKVSEYSSPSVTELEEVIKTADGLMRKYKIRTDYPLKTATYDKEKSEWILVFDSERPDAAFELFIAGPASDRIDIRWAGSRKRESYPKK